MELSRLLSCGSPLRGAALERLKVFLGSCGLKYDEKIEYSVYLTENNEIIAAGSLDGQVLKCIAVSPKYQSEGLAARIISELLGEAARRGHFHVFLFTALENEALFGGLGFYRVAKTGQILLMENKKHGVEQFVASFKLPKNTENYGAKTGAIVLNCNPFTCGHLYLIETASKKCDILYLFAVSEDKSRFPAETRLKLIRLGTAHLPNVYLCPTGPYLVSSATFPDYFIKDDAGAIPQITLNTELDLTVFAECFARPLGIKQRYVGTEPFDGVTAVYNKQMKEYLPSFGIDVIEIPRLEKSGAVISASRVRRLLDEGNIEAVKELVPPATYEYLTANPAEYLFLRRICPPPK